MLNAADGSFSIKLPPQHAQRVSRSNAARITLGIRPIDISAHHKSSDNGVIEFEGTVYTFEALGEEGQIAANVGETQVLVVTAETAVFEQGQKVWLQPRTERIHLFNADTGLAL